MTAPTFDHLDEDPCRSEIVLRRIDRFFGQDGICACFERLGDHLVQAGEIATYLADVVPGLNRDSVIRRFRFSAKNNWFGRHGGRQTIDKLLDLDWYGYRPRGRYSLRPSYLRVETAAVSMRARRSVWAQWIQAQGWPVPPEFTARSRSSTEDAKARKSIKQIDLAGIEVADRLYNPVERTVEELQPTYRRRRAYGSPLRAYVERLRPEVLSGPSERTGKGIIDGYVEACAKNGKPDYLPKNRRSVIKEAETIRNDVVKNRAKAAAITPTNDG